MFPFNPQNTLRAISQEQCEHIIWSSISIYWMNTEWLDKTWKESTYKVPVYSDVLVSVDNPPSPFLITPKALIYSTCLFLLCKCSHHG